MLTSLAVVKSFLGITVSTYDTQLNIVIAGVDEAIKRYCARNFEATNVIFKTAIESYDNLVLDETPVNAIYYAGTGQSQVLDLSYTGANFQASVRNDAGVGKLTLIADLTKTDITMAFDETLSELATAIGLIAGWTATLASGYDNWPANCLLDQSVETEESANTVSLRGAVHQKRLVRVGDEGIFHVAGAGISCDFWSIDGDPASPNFVCLYNGGYTTVPAGLTSLAIKICCDAWRNFANNAATRSETVGDYSYDKWPQSQIASAIGPYQSALDLYRRV